MNQESKWIAVEKPPKEESNYLVWMPRIESEAVILGWDGKCFYDERAGEIRTEDVTHWMPIPSPPKTAKP